MITNSLKKIASSSKSLLRGATPILPVIDYPVSLSKTWTALTNKISKFTFTCPSSTSGNFTLYMNGTTYTVVMSTNQATNGANIIAAINAGSLATATYASGTVTVTAGSAILLTTPSMYNSTTQLGIEPVPVQSTPMDIDVSNATSLLFHLYITFGTSYPNVPYFKVMSRPYGIETKTGSATYMGYYNLPQVNAVSINSVICNTGSNTTQSKVIGGSLDPTDSNYYAFGYTQTRQLSLVVDVPVGGLQLVVPFICMTNAYDPATANPTRLISLLYQTVYK